MLRPCMPRPLPSTGLSRCFCPQRTRVRPRPPPLAHHRLPLLTLTVAPREPSTSNSRYTIAGPPRHRSTRLAALQHLLAPPSTVSSPAMTPSLLLHLHTPPPPPSLHLQAVSLPGTTSVRRPLPGEGTVNEEAETTRARQEATKRGRMLYTTLDLSVVQALLLTTPGRTRTPLRTEGG